MFRSRLSRQRLHRPGGKVGSDQCLPRGARDLRPCRAVISGGVFFLLHVLAPEGAVLYVVYFNFFVSFIAVFALRGIYFALLEENRTPKFLTGAAVGMISVVGFTPEIFFASIAGRILDANPGIVGHQNYFLFLTVIAASGVVVIGWLLWLRRTGEASRWPGAARYSGGEINYGHEGSILDD